MAKPYMFTDLHDPKLIRFLRDGSVGVIPTDTVYGLVGLAALPAAVKRLYGLKKREQKPGTVIAASIEQLVGLGIKAAYLKPVQHFWPGPVSVIIPSGQNLEYIHVGKGGIALRIPANVEVRSLLEQTGALITSSVNHPGEPPATTIAEARDYFGDQVDFYIDGGDLGEQQPSTIIRVVDDAIEVIREGAVKINEKGEIEQ